MSKKIFQLVCEIKHHTQDLQANIKAIIENKRQLAEFIGKPKYDVIMRSLPIFEAKVKYHKSQVQKFSQELAEHEFLMSDDFDEWMS